MARRDIEMAVVTVNLRSASPTWDGHLQTLADHGLAITETNTNIHVVEGTIPLDKVHDLEKLDFVTYVRKQSHYSAEHEAGHPLDRNNGIGTTPDSVFPAMARRRIGKQYP